MRHEPALVHRIAGEPAAEVVVDAALADVVERDFNGGEIAISAGAQAGAPQAFEQRSLRKFRRAARAAIDRIDEPAKLARGIVEFGAPDRCRAGGSRRSRKPL